MPIIGEVKKASEIGRTGSPELELTEEEIIGDFCKTCDYSLDGCVERGQQATCKSYQEALRQKTIVAKAQLAKAALYYQAEIEKWKFLQQHAVDVGKEQLEEIEKLRAKYEELEESKA
jgi:hypothetical protein